MMLVEYLPVLLLLVLGLTVGAVMLTLSYFLGPRTRKRTVHDSPYESGLVPTGDARQRVNVKFYIIAMLFILFDVEIVFLFPWAVLFDELGGFGLFAAFTFLLVLTVGLVYEWKKGALEWD
ncbi:MAG TPA: NADH-quinone oxidoreductase subunit A [Gemmatimonadota bacterium]|nr:NADH-quinone oxidoreductase subunit A [Gemmatimonadota bacterium]